MEKIFILLILLNVCHFLGDYSHLSTTWMLSAKRLGKPVLPIAAHSLIHTSMFFGCVFVLYGIEKAWIAAAVQFPTHLIIDLMKGKMNAWFIQLQDPSNKFHWYMFGFDQFLHQSVIIITAYIVHV